MFDIFLKVLIDQEFGKIEIEGSCLLFLAAIGISSNSHVALILARVFGMFLAYIVMF